MTAPALMIGPFPPPVHGFAVITDGMAAALEERMPVARCDMAPPPSTSREIRLFYHVKRLARTLASLGRIRALRRAGGRCVYLGSNDGLGLVHTLLQVSAARAMGLECLLHHHSYKYIDRANPLMRAVLRAGGRRLRHIFLSPGMADAFAARYGPVPTRILENAAFVRPVSFLPRPTRRDTIRLGLLSNLTAEKGLYDFLRLIEHAIAEDLPIEGSLAGPANTADRAAIEAMVARSGGRLRYEGPLFGKPKSRFFQHIDVFVFPTSYATEAQPTVIFEAQAHGRPVIARARGAIPEQLEDPDCAVPPEADFTAAVLRLLDRHATRLPDWQHRTHAAYVTRHLQARQALAPIASELVPGPSQRTAAK